MSALAKIHIAKKQLGLDDDTYRDVLERVTARRSSKGMSNSQHMAVLDEFKRLGWKSDVKRKGGLSGTYAKKLQALWIAGWNLGLVNNRKDAALIAFVKRQTGIQSMSWLRDPKDADKAVEALKKWLARAGVDWSVDKLMPPFTRAPGYKIALAQYSTITHLADGNIFYLSFVTTASNIVSRNFPTGRAQKRVETFTAADWIKVMNALGVQVRAMKKVVGIDGKYWVSSQSEFDDGRFELLDGES